ncbi:class I SAM-dependent methyltransferase [Oceanibaculum nanhaiense]|uniref:class I SAM-dependent methyltransferase n=1 Tax=Oceanibaculum nanhaiense TaxID=1909734 RepID=UPI000A367F6D|nr:class I SAM-dependent methyltransferase [Oceanibaculum nanhaiense]
MSDEARWGRYYDAVTDRPPRPTLLHALDRFALEGIPAKGGPPPFALDLGCGDGRDTLELLRRGWRVLALDATAEAIERLLARPDLPDKRLLETRIERFEDFLPPACDLVNASFSLPLCVPADFPALWARLTAAIRPGGRFAGQLYGPQDDWAGRGITIHDRAAIDSLCAGFSVEKLDETIEDGVTALGKPKRWHIFHLVLAKQPACTFN